jgi:uncharacterized protein (TIGR00299 family) protein
LKQSLIVDAFSGAAGDMMLAALIDAGASVEVLQALAASIPALANVRVSAENVRCGPFAAKKLVVTLPHEHAHRGLSDIVRIIDSAASLSPVVSVNAKNAFTRLAAAEARVHGTSVEKVHFHEVGALDAILDVVGFFVLAEELGVESFYYTTLAIGARGTIQGEHGEMPVPAPATLELLTGHRITHTERQEELMTPTAAALIAAVFQPLPLNASVVMRSVGYGAGTRESKGMPNVVRVSLAQVTDAAISAYDGAHFVSVIRCTIDNMNPELYGDLMQRLFDERALEVYYTPVMMKKNRPGTEITVLCEHADLDHVSRIVLTHSTTLGLRVAREARVELPRRIDTVETEWGPARIKVATRPDGSETASPEYESCREIARRTGLTLTEVSDAVRRVWLRR